MLLFRSSLSGGGDTSSYEITVNGNAVPAFDVTAMPISILLNDDYEEYSIFNDNIMIGNNITNCSGLCSRLESFNCSINIPNGVKDCSGMFSGCYNFNLPVEIPESVINANGMFSECTSFNQPINIPDNLGLVNDMFSYCENFNQPINFPTNMKDITGVFSQCSSFNSPVNLPERVYSCQAVFGSTSFDQPINLPDILEPSWRDPELILPNSELGGPYAYMFANSPFNQPLDFSLQSSHDSMDYSGMFGVAESYNQPITLPDYLDSINCVNMFERATSFNQPIYNLNTAYRGLFAQMFNQAWSFNQPIEIPPSDVAERGIREIADCAGMFSHAFAFDSPVTFLGDSYTSFYNMFAGQDGRYPMRTKFSQAINLPSTVYNCSGMFSWCQFNNSITMPDYVEDCSDMFHSSYFNQPINIPIGVKNCSNMFAWSSFNQYATIPEGVVDCSYMFAGVNLKGGLDIPSSVKNCRGMLWSASCKGPIYINEGIVNCSGLFLDYNFNSTTQSNIQIPVTVQNYTEMFGCLNEQNYFNLPKNIYFEAWENLEENNFNAMIAYRKNTSRCNIWCYPELYDVLINASIANDGIKPSWTDFEDGNGCYNTGYNIYIYKNYEPTEEEGPGTGDGPIVINP